MSECSRIRTELERLLSVPRGAWPGEVAAHVSACQACGRALATARLARGLVVTAAGGIEPSASFAARVMAAVRSEARPWAGAGDLWRPAWTLLPVFGGVAAALLVLFFQGSAPGGSSGVAGWAVLDQSLSAGERLVLGAEPPDLDLVLAAVIEDDGR